MFSALISHISFRNFKFHKQFGATGTVITHSDLWYCYEIALADFTRPD